MVDRYEQTDRGMRPDEEGGWVDHADYVALLAERDALATQVEAMKRDGERLDWLCERVINVRDPFPLGGSESLFWASPTDDDGGHTPSNLREQINAACQETKP